MDSECKNTKHVNKLCSSLYMTIKKISKICNDISSSTAKTLMQPLVLFCLEYCNSLLIRIAKCHINRDQRFGFHIIFLNFIISHLH